ncbi:hypothetical protein GCM10010441_42720 [Kitasatospora paracochleata]
MIRYCEVDRTVIVTVKLPPTGSDEGTPLIVLLVDPLPAADADPGRSRRTAAVSTVARPTRRFMGPPESCR